MREQDKLDDEVYIQQFPHADKHLYKPDVQQPEWYEIQAAMQQAAQQPQGQMPQQGQYGGGPMAQQFNLGGVPQAQAAMVPAPQPMMPAQQSAQQAAMLPGTPISAMT
jgi:hypothetical protein